MPHPLVNPNPEFPAGYSVFRPAPGQNITCPASTTVNCSTNVLGPTVFTNVNGSAAYTSHGISTDLAAFATERVWLTDHVSVIGSLRLDRYIAELRTVTYAGAASPPGGLKVKSNLTSPRVSLLWEPTADRTFYASWGRSETPQGTSIVGSGTALTVSAKDLEPEQSQIWEVGAKVAIPRTSLAATISLFDIKKDNAVQIDPGTGFLAQSGERQEVKGVELGLSDGVQVEVLKGLAPQDKIKVTESGNPNVLLTERGVSFGYNTLINDFRGLPVMAETGHPVMASFEPGEDWFWDFALDAYVDGPRLAAPDSHPAEQTTPGPADRVPGDWQALLAARR